MENEMKGNSAQDRSVYVLAMGNQYMAEANAASTWNRRRPEARIADAQPLRHGMGSWEWNIKRSLY